MGKAQRGLGIIGIAALWAACSSSEATFSPVSANAGRSGSSAEDGGHAGTPASAGSQSGHGGAPASAGKGATGGDVAAGGAGGEAVGGSSVGGKGGTAGGGKGGTAGGGGKGGTAGGGGKGGTAGGGSAPGGAAGVGNDAGAGGTGSCLDHWKGSLCDSCSPEVQADRAQCSKLLECYRKHDCSPQTCSGEGEACSVAELGVGTAPFPIAAGVYECLCH